jgi:hypothetical protein
MKRKDYRTGLITMCIGGGMGMAMIVERWFFLFTSAAIIANN